MRCNPPLTPFMGSMSSLWISIKKRKSAHTNKKKTTSNTHDTTNARLHLLREHFPQFHKLLFHSNSKCYLTFPSISQATYSKYYLIFKLVNYCMSFAEIHSQAHKQVDQSTQNTHNGNQPEHIIFILVSIFYNKIMDFIFPNLPYMKPPPKITPLSNIKL